MTIYGLFLDVINGIVNQRQLETMSLIAYSNRPYSTRISCKYPLKIPTLFKLIEIYILLNNDTDIIIDHEIVFFKCG